MPPGRWGCICRRHYGADFLSSSVSHRIRKWPLIENRAENYIAYSPIVPLLSRTGAEEQWECLLADRVQALGIVIAASDGSDFTLLKGFPVVCNWSLLV